MWALWGGRKILRPYKWKSGYSGYRSYNGYGLLGMWAWWDGRDKKVGFAEKNCACGGGVGGCVGVGIEGRAQNIAPLQVEKWL